MRPFRHGVNHYKIESCSLLPEDAADDFTSVKEYGVGDTFEHAGQKPFVESVGDDVYAGFVGQPGIRSRTLHCRLVED